MFLIFLTMFFCVLYYYVTKNHDYWTKRNVKHEKPVPFFGNLYQNVMGIKSATEVAVDLYNKYAEEKVFGFYKGCTPELVVRDLELVRRILNLDFTYFYPRGIGRYPENEPVMTNLFHVDGDMWKLLRQRLTAAFTTAKLKNMFPLIIECAKKLHHVGDDIVMNKGGECDVRELMARFSTEFIGACGFGIQMDSINNENSLFRELGRKLFQRSWRNRILVAVWELIPILRTPVQKLLAENELVETVEVILNNIRAQRNNKPCGRNDFVDLLLELKAEGKIRAESIEKKGLNGTPETVEMELDSLIMAAQMVVFFLAGFETSSSATSYTLHQLAFHPEIQANIQSEIDVVLQKYDDQLCYNSISEMKLLSYAFKEGMRIFPSVGVLNRVCARKYTIPELNLTIDPGVKIVIPVQAIHNDEKYFDDPSQFIPGRFADEGDRHKYAYLPFGAGPRQCIGGRLGEMQSLAGLAVILRRYTVEPGPNTRRQLEINHKSNVIQGVVGGLPLKLKLRGIKS